MPGIVSGGLGGLALIGGASGLLNVLAERRQSAACRVALDGLIDDATEVVNGLGRHYGPSAAT